MAPDDGGAPQAGPEGPAASPRRRVSRRGVLAGGLLLGTGALTAKVLASGAPSSHGSPHAAGPGASTSGSSAVDATPPLTAVDGQLVVSGRTVLTRDLTVSQVVVEPGGVLVFPPNQSVTVRSLGNVMVHGRLEMQPADKSVQHVLSFPAINEASYTGGMAMVTTDIGMWVMGSGYLALQGSARTAWLRAATPLKSGATVIDLAAAPTGWAAGDELVVTPTVSPKTKAHYDAFDTVVVAAVSGRRVTLRAPLGHDHPLISVGRGVALGAEVLNLTRNVRIEGTSTGRPHIWILSSHAQQLGQVAIRYMGPRKQGNGVLSRYGLHFHTCGDGSRGSQVRDVVVRDCGNHAFVAHASHGVTFTSCISHNTVDDAYWWDQAPNTRQIGPATNEALYEACVASRVLSPDPKRGYRLTGFNLSTGDGNAVHDCVAVGVQGSKNSSGFEWPESGTGVWDFADNIAHNNKVDGIFTWQNNNRDHVIDRFVAYHNGQAGIEHGAYNNSYRYQDSILYGNGETGLLLHAVSAEGRAQEFTGLLLDGAGRTDYVIEVVKHTLPTTTPTQLIGCELRGYKVAGVGFIYDGEDGGTRPDYFDIVACHFAGNQLWLSPTVDRSSAIRLQSGSSGAVSATSVGGTGVLDRQWNANVTAIAPFASTPSIALTPIVLPNSAPAPSGK